MKMYSFLLLLLFPFLLSAQDKYLNEVVAEMKKTGCDKALPVLNQKVKSGKAMNVDYYKKAWCELDKGLADVSLQSLRSGLALTTKQEPLYGSMLFLRSTAYMDLKKLDAAILDLEQAVKLFPKNVNYLVNLSYLYGETERYADCLTVLEKARLLDDRNHILYVNLAYYSAETEDYKGAIRYADKGLTLAKDSISIGSLMNSLGFAQSKIISTEKGLATIESSLRVHPRNAYAYFNMGRIYKATNKKDRACASFLKAKALGGINLTAKYLLTYCK